MRSIGFTWAIAVLGFVGCGKQELSKNTEASHGDHGAHSSADAGKKPIDKHGGHQPGQGAAMLMVKTDPADIKPNQPVKISLMIHGVGGAMVKDFETVHEKKLHLIIVRDGLDQFAHIHPEIDSAGNITAAFSFPTAGKYRLYADHKPTGKDAATAVAEVVVVGTPPPTPDLITNVPGRVKNEELVADIAIENPKAMASTRVSFALSDSAGMPVADLQPYLGAMGHLVILSADGKQYVHSHPLAGKSSPGTVEFDAHFPSSGIFKGWVQFQRANAIQTVPFVVKIE